MNIFRIYPYDLVEGRLGWESYSVTKAALVNKVDGKVASLSHYLGVLGGWTWLLASPEIRGTAPCGGLGGLGDG